MPLHEWKEHASTGQKLGDLNVNGDGNLNYPLGDEGIITWLFDSDSFSPAGKVKSFRFYIVVNQWVADFKPGLNNLSFTFKNKVSILKLWESLL